MFNKLSFIESRFEELSNQIADPAVMADMDEWRKLCKEHSDMTPIVEKYREYKANKNNIEESTAMLDDPEVDKEFKDMLNDEIKTSKEKIAVIEEELKILLLPKDPNDDKNVIVEIRGGAGGDEAALFAADLYRMYTMYAESKRWKTEIMNLSEIGIGGIKEVSFMIEGQGAYSRLKFESGVHRVQRVPETESQGRVHTSTVTVAVLPEAEEVDFEINPADLQIDTFRASGAGGQHINKTESAIRITHIPTGVIVECQDERSQFKNKDKALKVLRSRLYEAELQKQQEAIAADRKSQVGTGDRSERIRTYNFPQGRVSDHRIGLTLYKIEAIMNGDIDEIIDALITTDQSEKLKLQQEG
ncbi:MAG: peptide chain release factor 1 [Clostridia bacterium]|nr:peptide chain release factor 1 [Clostridia bacterium]